MRYGGKPLGWRKPEGVRKQRQLRCYDDEWELIKRFAKIAKYGNKLSCERFLAEQEVPLKYEAEIFKEVAKYKRHFSHEIKKK